MFPRSSLLPFSLYISYTQHLFIYFKSSKNEIFFAGVASLFSHIPELVLGPGPPVVVPQEADDGRGEDGEGHDGDEDRDDHSLRGDCFEAGGE